MVTARRTSERLQDVPISVTAFGGAQIAERRIQSEVDLQIATPGLTVRQTGSSDQLNFSIRGQSIDAFSFSSPAVTAYFNEVEVGGVAATSFFDLASIQVLKGPQGTLFGRNATGGAVLYAAQVPTKEFGGYAKLSYGNYNGFTAEGAINIPVSDAIAIRLSGKEERRDGFQHNLLLGLDVNSIDSQVGRVSVLVAPTGSIFSNVAVFQEGRFGGRTGAVKMQNANGVNGAPATYFDPITNTTKPLITFTRDTFPAGTVTTDPRVNALFNGVGDFLLKQQNVGFYDYYAEADQTHRGRQALVTNTTTLDFGPEASLKNIAGYNNVQSFERSSITGSPYEFLTVGGGATEQDSGYTFGTKEYSDELQLSGKYNALKYIFGAYYSHIETHSRIPLRVAGILGAPYLGPYDFTVTDQSKALYGQLTYAITDRLNLSGGIRYTFEDVSILQSADSLVAFLNNGKHSRSDSKPSWLASIDYKLTNDLLVYFTQRGSWRTGGFNGTDASNAPNASTFAPETTYDFEGGAKYFGDIAGVRSRLNIAVFDQYIQHVQRAPYLNISALAGNVNKARVTGVEVDGDFNLTKWLEVGGAYSYTHARYTDPLAVVGANTFYFGPYGDTPESAGSLFVRLSDQLPGKSGELALRGEVFAQTSFFYSNLADTILPGTRIPGYALLNARAEWNGIAGTKIDAALFVNNLTQKHYFAGGFPLGAVTGSNGTLPGTPRMFGIEAGIKF